MKRILVVFISVFFVCFFLPSASFASASDQPIKIPKHLQVDIPFLGQTPEYCNHPDNTPPEGYPPLLYCKPATKDRSFLVGEYKHTNYNAGYATLVGYSYWMCVEEEPYSIREVVGGVPEWTIQESAPVPHASVGYQSWWGIEILNPAGCRRVSNYDIATGTWVSNLGVFTRAWFQRNASLDSQIWSNVRIWVAVPEGIKFYGAYGFPNSPNGQETIPGTYAVSSGKTLYLGAGGASGSWAPEDSPDGWGEGDHIIIQPIGGDWGTFDFLREGFNVLIDAINRGLNWLGSFFMSLFNNIYDFFSEGLKTLFAPSEDFVQDEISLIKQKWEAKVNIDLTSLQDLQGVTEGQLEDVSISLLGKQCKILDFVYVRENLHIMRNVLGVMILALTGMFIYKQAIILVGH